VSVAIVVGTRPEIIKIAPIIRAFQNRSLDFRLIHTGQHYDYELSKLFIQELELPVPDYSFRLRESKPAAQIGEMMIKLGRALRRIDPKLLIIQGDTNSMLASALTGVKLSLPLGHVEAGLRSYDWQMPEEHNRRMVDHVSDFLFAPTNFAKRNLENEKVHGKIFVTGNTVIDAVKQYMPVASKKSVIMEKVKMEEYALVTFHRSENVDNPAVLGNIVRALTEMPIHAVFPVHPRTSKRLRQYKLLGKLSSSKSIQLLPPIGYFDFLMLMKNCKIILTDSGGLQEEATAPWIRKPVLVLKASTERPEAVESGFARVVGVEKRKILKELKKILEEPPKLPDTSPFGDGNAGVRIAEIVEKVILRGT
jgi:UDP-N-acetylglucosamine 2-epimerase (non-hydrolysing)